MVIYKRELEPDPPIPTFPFDPTFKTLLIDLLFFMNGKLLVYNPVEGSVVDHVLVVSTNLVASA